MNFDDYFENVYFQFYNKLDEVEFYLQCSIDNHTKFAQTAIPRDIQYLNTAQFYFSAFINALISTWEIAKLSITIENPNSSSIRETVLTNNIAEFLKYFTGATVQDHKLFQFLKLSRNACSHDGTMALVGGIGDSFIFSEIIERFDFEGSNKAFTHAQIEPPQKDAIKTMLLMVTKLVPLFEAKLKMPTRPYRFEVIHPNAMTDKRQNVQNFVNKFSPLL
jgi:hypothetical protein